VAALRRSFACTTAAYFDDLPVIDVHAGCGAARSALRVLLGAIGAPPGPEKGFGGAQYRVFLGANVRVPEAVSKARITIEPNESTRSSIVEMIDRAVADASLTRGVTSKLRGMIGWLASNSMGRVGRLGAYRLKRRQYGHDPGSNISTELADTLSFLKHLVQSVPPHTISLVPATRPPLIA